MGNPWAYDFSAIGARQAPLLIVVGSDVDPREKSTGGYQMTGNSDVHQLIPESVRSEELNLSQPFLKDGNRLAPGRYDCVLNLVTDPDQHSRTLARLAKLLRGYKGKVINRPEAVLKTTRDQVARRLANIDGLRVPKVLRLHNPKPGSAAIAAGRAGIGFPVIVRQAGTHTGDIIGLIDDPGALDSACQGGGDIIATEFVDFVSSDGLYRKYRLWSFGGRTVFKHVVVSDKWNIHNKDRDRIMLGRPDLIAEERDMMSRPEGDLPEPVHVMFREVRRRLGLDFFGMDFGIDASGQAVLFEANATMSFIMKASNPAFHYLDTAVEPAKEAFREMLGLQAHP